MAGVTLAGVRKIYEDRGRSHVAVERIDLEIADGEFVVLVGPSGCGKSTTLRMIAGLERLTEGELRIGGRLVNDIPARDRDIAMVFQNYALYPHMSAYRNMAFALELRRLGRSEIERRVRGAAQVLGIVPVLDRLPRQLSGGERQRVALGRAIVRQPQAFLFDEPLSNLDARLRVQMRREIARLHRALGATMIYVTHDQVEAMTLGDRIVVMSGGRVQQVDSPAGLYERPSNTFVAGFIGSPPMNLIPGVIAADRPARFEPRGASIPVRLDARWEDELRVRGPRPAILGIRPEDLRPEDLRVEGRPASGGAETIWPVEVQLVEQLGGEALVHVRREMVELTARLPVPLPPGELRLRLPEERLHLFDPASGERLAP